MCPRPHASRLAELPPQALPPALRSAALKGFGPRAVLYPNMTNYPKELCVDDVYQSLPYLKLKLEDVKYLFIKK